MTGYTGTPFKDERHGGEPQIIPGRVMCAYYDMGGEGVAYHDSDEGNHGSGALNPADGSYLNEFRMDENVDTSYMKPDFDATENNMVTPEMGILYVGWTEPGEWLRYTVEIKEERAYDASIFYSAAHGGTVQLLLDGEPLCEPVAMTLTNHPHHWNEKKILTGVSLPAGCHVLELKTVDIGKMNYAYVTFR